MNARLRCSVWSISNWLLAVSFLSTCPATQCGAADPDPKRTTSEKYALLVGVREYDPNELRKLPYSEPDVDTLANVLRKNGYLRENVVLMTQTEGAKRARALPTAANIRKELKGLLEDREAGDTVVVAFAGHGVQFVGEEATFFCPMDARLKDRSTLVSLEEVYKQMESCQADVKLLLVDACRNDPRSDNSRARAEVDLESVSRPQGIEPPGGVVALFSCSKGQKAFEHDTLKHGVFFHFVIEALEGKGDLDKDGQLDLLELTQFTQRRVKDFVRAEYGADVKQTPELKGQLRGAPTLVAYSQVNTKPATPSSPPIAPPKIDPKKPITGGTTTANTNPPDPSQTDRKRPMTARVTRKPSEPNKPTTPPPTTNPPPSTNPSSKPSQKPSPFDSLPPGELAAAPARAYWAPDADYLGGFDVTRLIRTTVFKRHALATAMEAWETKVSQDESIASLGFDPLRDLRSVSYYGHVPAEDPRTNAVEPGHWAVLLDGRMNGALIRSRFVESSLSEAFVDVAGVRHTLFTDPPAAPVANASQDANTPPKPATQPAWYVVVGNERIILADAKATLTAALNRAAVIRPVTPIAAGLVEPVALNRTAAESRDQVGWLLFRDVPRNGVHGAIYTSNGLEKLTGTLAVDEGIRLRVVQQLKDEESAKTMLATMDATTKQLQAMAGAALTTGSKALALETLGELRTEATGRTVTTRLDLSESQVADIIDASKQLYRRMQENNAPPPRVP